MSDSYWDLKLSVIQDTFLKIIHQFESPKHHQIFLSNHSETITDKLNKHN